VRGPSISTLDLERIGLTASWLLELAPALIEQRCRELPPAQARRLAQEGLRTLKARPDLDAVLRRTAHDNFHSSWTNDYPRLRVKIRADFGNFLLESSSQHAFMLPWTICDVAAGTSVESYNANLSRAVARLLSDDFPGYAHLIGGSLVSAVVWQILGDLMAEPRPAHEAGREMPAVIPTSRQVDCALLQAARNGQADGCQALLTSGADIECRDEKGRTPLILAIKGKSCEATAALLAAGADVDVHDNDGDTPLLHAVPESGFLRALRSTLDKSAKQAGDHAGLVQLLLQAGADPSGANRKYGTTPILKVAQMKQRGDLPSLQLLIEAGASVNVADDAGQTALMHAAYPPFHGEMFQLLVRAGANTESRRNDGCTGLISAAAGGETEAARAWIEAGADVNASGPNGNTPLMLAARGWPDIVEALLAAGADVNSADNDGDTAVQFAVLGYRWSTEQDKMAIVQRLLQAGADVRRRNRKGHSALTELLRQEREKRIEEEVLREFQSRPQECEPEIMLYGQDDSALCRLLRDAGCEV
jgi:ankyrin repeat protein